MATFLFFLPLLPKTHAHPISNSSSEIVGWTDAPQVRGTFDLLLSCLTTLALCAWTAYHPNVYHTRHELRRVGKRTLWMGVAVLVPELVLWCAWEQWGAAKRLKRDIDAMGERCFDGVGVGEEGPCYTCGSTSLEDWGLDLLFREEGDGDEEVELEQKSSKKVRSFASMFSWRSRIEGAKEEEEEEEMEMEKMDAATWTTAQAFFAVSGGYAIRLPYLPCETWTLTPTALLFLARHGLLPSESPEEVEDKSKADTVAKVLVCIQAGWFLVQCLARLAQNLPLTLLEVHVLTHVLCAFVMYVLWINKPYDVANPVIVQDERVKELGALWSLCDRSASFQSQMDFDKFQCAYNGKITIEQVQSAHKAAQSTSAIYRYWKMIVNFFPLDERLESTSSEMVVTTPATPEQLTHLNFANTALEYLKTRNVHFPYLAKIPIYNQPSTSLRLPLSFAVSMRSNLIIDGLPNAVTKDEERGKHSTKGATAYMVIGSVYGGLHVAAWNFRFATPVEMWFWRASGLCMISAPMASILTISLLEADSWRSRWFRRSETDSTSVDCSTTGDYQGQVPLVIHKQHQTFASYALHSFSTLIAILLVTFMLVSGLVMMVSWTLYPVARVYVLVESFAALRASEKGIYTTVEWTNFIPHAG